jgi:outer membrane protein assembly factor BamA
LFSVSGTGRLQYDKYDQAFTARDASGSLLFERPFFARRLRLSGGWQYHVIDIDADERLQDRLTGEQALEDSLQTIGYFQQAVTLDLRDNQFNPRRGMFAEIQLEESGVYSLSELGYQRGQIDLRGYVPVAPRLVLAVRGLAGLLRENEEAAGEPLTRRFYAGGASSHRGFGYRDLSPFVVDRDPVTGEIIDYVPVGGKAHMLLSAELRLAVTKISTFGLELAAFVDAGDVTQTYDDFDANQLHYAVGPGLRLQTPLGPLRVDLGIRLNRRSEVEADGRFNPSPGDRVVFHLTFGEPF